MLRFLLAGALAGALAFVPSSHAQSLGTDASRDAHAGWARGAWDLPAGGSFGHVRGVLIELREQRFVLEGRLDPLPIAGGTHTGVVNGRLYPITDDGVASRPVAEFHGAYLVGAERRGRFEGAITSLTRPGTPPVRLGHLEGRFRDPSAPERDPVGRFEARWVLRR